jgi:hypothetical protein
MERDFVEPTPKRSAPVRSSETEGNASTAAHPALPIASAVGNRAFARAVQRSASGSQGAGPLDEEIAGSIDARRGGGAPLRDDVRTDMEDHLGVDLSSVKVHTDSASDSLNRSVQAEAFTSGSDVFFSSGKYDPDSASGRSLLAHELTHVVQQSTGAGVKPGEVSRPEDPAEVEAKAMGDAIGSAPSTAAPAAATAAVAREEDEVPPEDEQMGMAVARQEAPEEEKEDEEEPTL